MFKVIRKKEIRKLAVVTESEPNEWRCEARSTFRTRKRKYLKDQINTSKQTI
jgi:hypothetical protein